MTDGGVTDLSKWVDVRVVSGHHQEFQAEFVINADNSLLLRGSLVYDQGLADLVDPVPTQQNFEVWLKDLTKLEFTAKLRTMDLYNGESFVLGLDVVGIIKETPPN